MLSLALGGQSTALKALTRWPNSMQISSMPLRYTVQKTLRDQEFAVFQCRCISNQQEFFKESCASSKNDDVPTASHVAGIIPTCQAENMSSDTQVALRVVSELGSRA